jgi:hypothetical protein
MLHYTFHMHFMGVSMKTFSCYITLYIAYVCMYENVVMLYYIVYCICMYV